MTDASRAISHALELLPPIQEHAKKLGSDEALRRAEAAREHLDAAERSLRSWLVAVLRHARALSHGSCWVEPQEMDEYRRRGEV